MPFVKSNGKSEIKKGMTAMMHLTKPLFLFALGLGCLTSSAREYEGSRENSILLNGQWEFARGDGNEGAQTATGQREFTWQQVKLPGPFMSWSQEAATQTKFVWARRNFRVTSTQAKGLAVLRWNRIAAGAAAFINGQKVGENEPTGPFQVIVPRGVLRSGENQIVLKIRGAAGVRRSQSGNPLIPTGFGPGMPEVTDDVWIDFADAVYMKWTLAMPDLAGSHMKIRVTPTGLDHLDGLKIVAQVKSWPDGKVVWGRAKHRPGSCPTSPPSEVSTSSLRCRCRGSKPGPMRSALYTPPR
jgi:hypothetical protein